MSSAQNAKDDDGFILRFRWLEFDLVIDSQYRILIINPSTLSEGILMRRFLRSFDVYREMAQVRNQGPK